MRKTELENRIETAISNCKPNNFEDILRQCGKQEGDIKIMKNKKRVWPKIACCAAAVFVLFAAGILGVGYYRDNNPAAVISLDVNPSIELKVNSRGKIIDAAALNADAVKILEGLDLKGSSTNVALHAIIGSMVKNGYLSKLSNSVLITVDGKNAQQLEQQLIQQIDEILSQSLQSGSVIGQSLSDDERIAQLAGQYGISAGKAQLILQLTDKNPLLVTGDLAELSINELNVLLSSAKVEAPDVSHSGQASTEAYIGSAAALKAALEHAAKTEAEVTELETELDLKKGILVYEVEFTCNGIEYEYIINAVSGGIISSRQESNDDDDDDNTNTPAFSAQDVRDIALSNAGLTTDKITGLDIELDKKNGVSVYEIEFKSGGTEYKYIINAQTKEIISSQTKADDDIKTPPATVIAEEKARDAALKHAQVKLNDISGYKSKLDDEDRRHVYEIEFTCNGFEYEYKIDAGNGDVISIQKERADDEDTGADAPSANITADTARAAALAHAGLSQAQITNYKCELDSGDGRLIYEIEFEYGNSEYDYEINAETGEIISADVETQEDN